MKKQTILYLIFAVVYAFVYAYVFDSKLDLNGDNANYLRLAKHLSHGLGYVDSTIGDLKPVNFYPPAYPFLLSIFMSVGINSLIFFKLLDGIFLFLSISGVFILVKRLTQQPNLAFVIAVLTVFCVQLMHFSNIVMSEMLYLFCSVACFFSLYKYSEKETNQFWKSPYFYLAILLAALSYHIRTIGLTIIFALLVFFLFRKEWKQAIASIAGIFLLFLPWSIRNSMAGLESRYLGTIMTVNPWRPEVGSVTTLGELIDKMLKNFDEIVIKGIKEILFPFIPANYDVPSETGEIIVGLIILAIIFLGAWHLGKFKWLFMGYLIANIGLLLLWHGGNGSRYLITITPFLFAFFYLGIFKIISLISKQNKKLETYLPFAFLMMFWLMLAPIKMLAEQSKTPYDPAHTNYFAIAKVMEAKAPKHTLVCCRKPELFLYYASDMYAVNYTYSEDTKTVIKDLIRKKVEYVVLEQLGYASTYRYLLPAIQQNAELFPIFWQLPNPDTYLLKFEREKAILKFGLDEK